MLMIFQVSGSLFYWKALWKIENYKQMNLTEPIVRDNLEWVEIINSEFINICIVRDDSYSVNIIISNLLIDENILI